MKFITSDTHFRDERLIPFKVRDFKNVKEMDRTLVKRWNAVVGPTDEVIHLGDFTLGTNKQDLRDLVRELNGRIILVKGNHDMETNDYYKDCGFYEVYSYPIIYENFILTHDPNSVLPIREGYTLLYGHVHNGEAYKTFDKDSVCMCCERHNYFPVSLDLLKKLYPIY